MSPKERLYTIVQAAEELDLARRTIRTQIERGVIRAKLHQTPTGTVWLIPESEVTRYAGERLGTQPKPPTNGGSKPA